MKKRLPYIILFVIITAVEVMIALFCHDGFVRYYLGDVIVVWAVYCFVQIFLCGRFSSCGVALGVMIFAFIVEFLQGVNIVDLIGLGDIPFFRVLIGTSFSPVDLLCYAVGTAAEFAGIFLHRKYRQA